MIVKSFEIKKKINNGKYFLLYGNNEGLIKDIIENEIKPLKQDIVYKYDEEEIIKDKDIFLEKILNKSFFDNEKLIIISRVGNKIFEIIEEIIQKNAQDIRIILVSKNLDKKSKLRNFFEKQKETICIPVYEDNQNTLNFLAQNFLKKEKISLSQENINLIIDRSRGDRINLINELKKIRSFSRNKKNINKNDIIKLTNLSENYDISELIDNTLAKNNKKTFHILNENNFGNEDALIIVRIFLSKLKRLIKLKTQIKEGDNLDKAISNFKPPIFWKEKEIVKKQIQNTNNETIKKTIVNLNYIELLIKKHPIKSTNIITNFLLEQVISSNN